MSFDRQTAVRLVGGAVAVIIAGQFLQNVIGYLIGALVLWLVASHFFGRR